MVTHHNYLNVLLLLNSSDFWKMNQHSSLYLLLCLWCWARTCFFSRSNFQQALLPDFQCYAHHLLWDLLLFLLNLSNLVSGLPVGLLVYVYLHKLSCWVSCLQCWKAVLSAMLSQVINGGASDWRRFKIDGVNTVSVRLKLSCLSSDC